MRVTRLQLQGFKSFASATELDLAGGITAIVGPNGSGKSNLVDAIRLVLGGAGARELRGQRLDHVIFGGGERRAPQGMAEVSITFDNEDGRFPVEDLEVALTRRVFRDGASEFRRNGTRVRMRDVGRLLEATGLTQSGYAIIAQNDIEAIIRANPAQRRHLVEEAAGIRGSQALLDESRSRLASLDQWLESSGGRLAELLPRIEELRSEAGVANLAADLHQRLRRLRGSLERAEWLAAVAESQRLERQLQAAERRRNLARAERESYELLYREQRSELERLEQGRLERERRLGELALGRQRLEAEAGRWSERALQAVRDRQEAALQLRQALDDLGELAGPAVDDQGQDAGEGRELELQALQQEVRQLDLDGSTIRAAMAQAELESRRANSARQEAERRVERLAARADAAAAAHGVALEGARQTSLEVEDVQDGLGKAQEQLIGAEREAAAAAAQLDADLRAETAARELLTGMEAGLSEAVAAEREAASRAAALEARVALAGSGRPIAQGVTEGRLSLRRLTEAVRPLRQDDARALDAALGAVAEALVGDEAEARRGLDMAGGTAELVAWGQSPPPPMEEVAVPGCRPLAAVLSGGEVELALIRSAVPFVCLAEDRPAAARWLDRQPFGRAVLPDGTVLGPGWERTAGAAEGAIGTAEQLRALQAEARRWAERATEARSKQEWAASQHQRRRSQVDATRAEVARTSATAAELRLAAERLEASLRELARRRSHLEEEADRQGPLTEQLRAELAAAESEREAAAASGEEAERLLALGGSRLAVLEGDRQRAAAALEVVRAELLQAEVQRRARTQMEQERRARVEQLTARRRAADGRIRAAEVAAVVALTRSRQLGLDLQAAAGALRAERDVATGSDPQASDPLQRLADLERHRAELEAAERAASLAAGELERALSDQGARTQALAADRDEVAVAPGSTEEVEDPLRSAQEMARLERRLTQLGPVNELAPTQLEELLVRTEGLRRAHDDVQSTRVDLEAIGAALGRLTAVRYRRALEQVSTEFATVWPELFGGGRAALVSVPGSEGELPGVDLEVQPRGKRVVPLGLLSGGERALTALALVLAIQQVAPSPFYVFDEVDAALDDANVGSFVRLVRERSLHSQFVLVTHSLTTMAAADHLYGVTQDGRGASRILSVRLAEDGRTLESQSAREASAVG